MQHGSVSIARATVSGQLSEPASAALRVVEHIARALGPGYRVSATDDDERGIVLDVAGGDPGPVIGRHGATIDAIEHLAAAVAFPPGADRRPLAVDAQGYRARRERRLRELALHAAEDAIRENAPMELDPMSAAERKVVHLALAEREDVTTSSDGREPAAIRRGLAAGHRPCRYRRLSAGVPFWSKTSAPRLRARR